MNISFIPTVIYEDDDIIVFNKPSGLLIHPYGVKGALHGEGETLVDWLVQNRPEVKDVGDIPELRAGIVHRLDRETSGIVLAVKTQEAFVYYKSLFQGHEMHKTYRAIVHGQIKEDHGVIDKPIGVRNGTIKRTVHGGRLVKPAITEYKVKEDGGEKQLFTLIEAMPKTGRTHQIRVHCSSLGNPIAGDSVYCTATSKKIDAKYKIPRVMLHAYSLEFTNQHGKGMQIAADEPEDFQAMWKKLSTI